MYDFQRFYYLYNKIALKWMARNLTDGNQH